MYLCLCPELQHPFVFKVPPVKVETVVQDILWCASSRLRALRKMQLHGGRDQSTLNSSTCPVFFFIFQNKPEHINREEAGDVLCWNS